jgi:hypothetical protein
MAAVVPVCSNRGKRGLCCRRTGGDGSCLGMCVWCKQIGGGSTLTCTAVPGYLDRGESRSAFNDRGLEGGGG